MEKRKKEMIKIIFAIIVLVVGIAMALYFGVWVMFIKAILTVCAAFDSGVLTATIVGWTIIKCLFATTVAGLILKATAGIVKALCK